MSRNAARAEPIAEYRLTTCLTTCIACGQPMPMAYTKKRKLMTRRGLVGLHLHIRWCGHAACPCFHHPYHPEEVGQWALPGQEFGLDVLVRVGQLRYREHRSCPEIHAQLTAQGRVILAIDGLQPDVGHEVLWVVRDVLSGSILCARSLLSSSSMELQALIGDVVAALPFSQTTRTLPRGTGASRR